MILSATQAAAQQGPAPVGNVGISEAVARIGQERSERARVTADQVVAEFIKMGFAFSPQECGERSLEP